MILEGVFVGIQNYLRMTFLGLFLKMLLGNLLPIRISHSTMMLSLVHTTLMWRASVTSNLI